LKIVPLDRKAIVRRMAKALAREMSKPRVRAISFIVEREDGWNIQTSHAHDIEAADIFQKAATIMRAP
jgi:hypothetical protein